MPAIEAIASRIMSTITNRVELRSFQSSFQTPLMSCSPCCRRPPVDRVRRKLLGGRSWRRRLLYGRIRVRDLGRHLLELEALEGRALLVVATLADRGIRQGESNRLRILGTRDELLH